MGKPLLKYFFLLTGLAFSEKLLSQQVITPEGDASTVLQILKADRYNFEKKDTLSFISLAGNVQLKKDKTFFFCDSAVVHQQQNLVEAFGRVHINDADSVHTYADYMRYVGAERKAYLRNNVRLTDNKGILTTPELQYEITTKIGNYFKGGRIVTGSTVLTSVEGTYYGDTRDVYFRQQVVLKDPEYNIATDTLLYNMETEVARFIALTTIVTDNRTVVTRDGYYDKKNKKAVFGKRSVVSDPDSELTADDMAFDDRTGFGQARGNAIYRSMDSANRTTIIADDIKFNRNANSFLATLKPLMIIEQEQDSLFIAADTLYSAKLSDLKKERNVPVLRDSVYMDTVAIVQQKDTNTNRFFEAYYNVRIFSDSLQAVGDRLFYSFEDSIFRLFTNPIVWMDENQITGDTIYLFTRNKKPEKMQVFEDGMIISHVEGEYFNQVRGNTINGFFVEGNIDYLRAKGSSRSVYYVVDEDSSFVGVSVSEADVTDMFFRDKKPQRVVFRVDFDGTTYPMRQVNHMEIRLRGFRWQDGRRPKSWQELRQ